ncbi:hypothetical protein YE105_C1058 [Yersinia enterocolitica subsp. palearctica 105.5R(r)]|uniref:Uncharacterized protein n=2 Tax=Yersinia enterocolitica TaxID=630 RepID=A0A0H3NNR9_YERE1|nr:hypothetical protein YE105_C1058 [Yersinia enterocolitica subsp. palearctica 105.5R(r)]CBX72658.1 unknown protein [Yersinia enterocolitica W22703]CBY26050.1 hypothetical protein Y11_21311 [Yersinia enterocolitica subsp. palearctica Y11]CCO69734.1 hypothetical protein D322_2860 [Yersinia enterocolitica IP 10393]
MTKDFKGGDTPPLKWRDSLRISLSLVLRAYHRTITVTNLIN